MSTLFARSADRDRQYTKKAKETGQFNGVPEAPIDVLIKLWNEILPHRTISLEEGKVSVSHVSLGRNATERK